MGKPQWALGYRGGRPALCGVGTTDTGQDPPVQFHQPKTRACGSTKGPVPGATLELPHPNRRRPALQAS